MKKIFLLITTIILFYAGNVNAEGISCEYNDDNVSFTVYIQDGNLTYDLKKGRATNLLKASDFSSNGKYECLPKIYYTEETLYSGETTYKFQKIAVGKALNRTNQSILEDTEEEVVPNPDDNTENGDNTENPSQNEGNVGSDNEVDVSFWGNLDVIVCGSTTVPAPVPPLVRLVVMVLKIVTPFVLIVMGMVDMLKAVIGSKDDEIKKEQQKFIKRIIAAVLVFFVVSILQFVVSFVAPEETDSVLRCVDCLINDASKCN